ncbi:hypothetical protein PUN28_008694 [Cardiocondyla obscurior]|uniref:Uncharacterized protein n=1 Tax=Cardiocondyla obscurior TaxID=286306 RepID=A0AAW2G422_9HYME
MSGLEKVRSSVKLSRKSRRYVGRTLLDGLSSSISYAIKSSSLSKSELSSQFGFVCCFVSPFFIGSLLIASFFDECVFSSIFSFNKFSTLVILTHEQACYRTRILILVRYHHYIKNSRKFRRPSCPSLLKLCLYIQDEQILRKAIVSGIDLFQHARKITWLQVNYNLAN